MSDSSMRDPMSVAVLHPGHSIEFNYREKLASRAALGSHKKPLLDVSKEVDSARPYAPGDSIRLIDWKAYARTDDLLVRQVRETTSARVEIVVDVSPTMDWPQQGIAEKVGPKKMEIALRLGLHLAFSHVRQGDQVAMWLFSNELDGLPRRRFRPRSSGDLLNLHFDLERCEYDIDQVLSYFPLIPESSKNMSDLAIWIGDGLSPGAYHEVLAKGRRGVMVHVLSCLELKDDWLLPTMSYADHEQAPVNEYLGATLLEGQKFKDKVHTWQKGIHAKVSEQGASYILVHDEVPLTQYLAQLHELQTP